MHAVAKGLGLGLANVFVIALGLGAASGHNMFGVGIWVVMFGFIPGAATGAVLGWLAYGLRSHPRWLRLLVLVVPAVLVVFWLAAEFWMLSAAPISCIPTGVAALLLERWTREPEDPPPLPVARMQ